ncbi:recombinase family protein, partial [Corynebacterium belfantii]
DSTNATASALNCSEYNFDIINILPCPAPAKQARRQPNPQQTHRIFTDEVSGATRARPGLEEALRYVREGDQLIVTSMDRCARSLSDLYGIVDGLVGRGVSVVFLKEVQTYSKDSSPVSRLMLGLLGSVAEFERAIIRERQAEGIAQAKARGVYKGRAPVLDASQVEQDRRWVAEGSQKQRLHVALG